MKKTQKGFAPILIILLGLVVTGGGLYLYAEKVSKEIPEVNSVSIPKQKETEQISREVVDKIALPTVKEKDKTQVDKNYDFGSLYKVINETTIHFNYESNFEDPLLPKDFHAEVSTFKVLDGYYAKDKNNVYYAGMKLEGANPDTFQMKEISIISYRNTQNQNSMFLFNKFYKETVPKSTKIAIDNERVYVGWNTLTNISPLKVKIEVGNGMGSIISDEITNWYLKGGCSGGNYVSEKDFFQGFFKDWTKEKYLNEYGFC